MVEARAAPAGVRRDRGGRHGFGDASPPPARAGRIGWKPWRWGTSRRGWKSSGSARCRSNLMRLSRKSQAEAHEHPGKERTLEGLLAELAGHRASGKRIVFTNGCFDLIHLGHVKYFQFARKQGDLLVVGVNTDAGIRRLKGPKRPIINEADRLGVLEEFESIDYLIKFDEDTPQRLIEQIRPDVLVKGADYQKEKVVGWDIVESYGGTVALAPLVDGKSTSGAYPANFGNAEVKARIFATDINQMDTDKMKCEEICF